MISWIFSNAEGWQSTESIVAGRFFFIWIGVKNTSRAPAWNRRSCTAPRYFRGKIVNIGLEFHDPFAGWRLFQIAEDRSQYVWPTGQIAGSQSIANFCGSHFGQDSNRVVEFRHDRGSGGRDQLKWNVRLANRDILEDFKGGRPGQWIFTMRRTESALTIDQT